MSKPPEESADGPPGPRRKGVRALPIGQGRRSVRELPAEQDDHDSWMMTYMDVVTLLLAAFIVILSLVDFEEPKGDGILDSARSMFSSLQSSGAPTDLFSVENALSRSALAERRLSSVVGAGTTVTRDGGTVRVDLPGQLLFESGSADLSLVGALALDRLVAIVRDAGSAVSIEGHTDDQSIATERFPSNWELSSARADAVVRHLVGRGVLDDRIRAIGYAHTRPRAPNDNEEGRALNRRVTLVLHPSQTF